MATVISLPEWPPWVEAVVYNIERTVRITVTYKQQSYTWEVPAGEAYKRDTLRIAYQVYAGLVQKQQALDAITKRLKS